jgi:hypothetical protein
MNTPAAITLNSVAEFQDCTLKLAEKAQRQIVIFTPDLEPDLYDSEAFLEQAVRLIKRSRQTRIRILITDSSPLVSNGHRMLNLFRHTDDQFQLKKYNADPATVTPAYFICDHNSIIRRQNPAVYQGFCYKDDRGRAKTQLEDFEQAWSLASNDANLRQLTL